MTPSTKNRTGASNSSPRRVDEADMTSLAPQGPSVPVPVSTSTPRRRIVVFAGSAAAPAVPMAEIGVDVDGREVKIPVTHETRVLWMEHFIRVRATAQMQTRSRILMSLVRAAYRKGLADGLTRTSG